MEMHLAHPLRSRRRRMRMSSWAVGRKVFCSSMIRARMMLVRRMSRSSDCRMRAGVVTVVLLPVVEV